MQNETSYRRFSKLIFNPKSEITNAILAANNFGYAYDPIGNRISATKNQEPENYSANQLNQYTQISDGVTNLPAYDLDGNMLTCRGWTFSWNGENRLIQASNATHVISYSYDYQGRMFQKVVDGVTNSYVWDGFNIVAEIAPGQTNFNVWGLDLSGTIQGAGGVGGLLSVAVAMPSAPCAMHFPLADGNGNITEYVATNGTTVAHREYSAFGETLALTGPKKDDFTFWFSTKPYDPLTKISHYQLRDYWAEVGRWGSRDPVGELGAIRGFLRQIALGLLVNGIETVSVSGDIRPVAELLTATTEPGLLAFVANDPLNLYDFLGLSGGVLKNLTQAPIVVLGNYRLTQTCIDWLVKNKAKYPAGHAAGEGIHGVLMILAAGGDTSKTPYMRDADGWWTSQTPKSTSGVARKNNRNGKRDLDSSTIFTEGKEAKGNTFNGEFLGTTLQKWLDDMLKVNFVNAITAGMKADPVPANCPCKQVDLDSINQAIKDTENALKTYPNVK